MSTNLRKKSFKLFKNPSKNNSRADLGPRSAWKKLSQRLTRSGEIPSPGQTSIHKTNDCAMKSERGAPVRGSDPPSGHSVHKTTGDRWWAPAWRLIQTHLGAAVYLRPVTMETRCFRKELEFQRYPPNDFCTACHERKSSKKRFQTFQKRRKK